MIRAEEVGAKLTDTQSLEARLRLDLPIDSHQVRCNTESTARQMEWLSAPWQYEHWAGRPHASRLFMAIRRAVVPVRIFASAFITLSAEHQPGGLCRAGAQPGSGTLGPHVLVLDCSCSNCARSSSLPWPTAAVHYLLVVSSSPLAASLAARSAKPNRTP